MVSPSGSTSKSQCQSFEGKAATRKCNEKAATTTVKRTRLGLHRDGSELTFGILLSQYGTDYMGGGTYFEAMGKNIMMDKGHVLLHCGKLKHAGSEITSGKRYIIVGFTKVLSWSPNIYSHKEITEKKMNNISTDQVCILSRSLSLASLSIIITFTK